VEQRSTRPGERGSSSTLVAARCLSGTSCYADGFSYGRNALSVFLEPWDGRSWSSSDAPPGGASLSWRRTAPGIEVVGVFGHPQTPGG